MGIRIEAARLRAFIEAIIAAMGSNQEEARIVAEHLVGSNLAGHDSHGVGMIPTYVESWKAGVLVPNQHAEKVQDSGAISVFAGARGYGQVITREAMDWAIGRARQDGMAIFGVRATHHVGRVGTYAEQALEAGLVAILFVNVITPAARVAPFGGRAGRYGTNPICIGFPGTENRGPVVLDFATSGLAAGKIRMAYNLGKPLPPGSLLDDDGRETTDPAVFIRDRAGSMLSFGGYKASGLALVCELLGGALTGAGVIQKSALGQPGVSNGVFGIVFDPARFIAADLLSAEVDAVLDWVKSADPAPGVAAVLVAGEPERLARQERSSEGIPLDDRSWAELCEAARAVGVARPEG